MNAWPKIRYYFFKLDQQADGRDTASFGQFLETSRNGASCKLARTLVSKGAPDAPVRLTRNGVMVLEYNSLHALAEKTFTETAGRPRMVKWAPHPGMETRS